jgi:hypothetical protein
MFQTAVARSVVWVVVLMVSSLFSLKFAEGAETPWLSSVSNYIFLSNFRQVPSFR